MAFTDKNIVITPNYSSSLADPQIVFTGGNATTSASITMKVYPNNSGVLSFEGSTGQLFSIVNDQNLLGGQIFSVNDISGIPMIDVNSNGIVTLVRFTGTTYIAPPLTGAIANNFNAKLLVHGGGIHATQFVNSSSVILKSAVADGASSVNMIVDSSATFLTTGAKLLSLRNNTIEKASVDISGGYTTTATSYFGTSYFNGSAVIIGGFGLGNGAGANGLNSALALQGRASTSGTAIKIGNLNTLTGTAVSSTTGKIVSFYSDTGATERSYVDASGSYVNVYTLWDDIQGPIGYDSFVTSTMVFENYGSAPWKTYFWRHSQSDEYMYMHYQLPHAWKRDTEVRPHLHFIPMVNPVASQTFAVAGSYAWVVGFGTTLPTSSWTDFSATISVSTTSAFTEAVLPLFNSTPTGSKESAVLCISVRRNSAVDTYTTNKVGGTAAANICLLSLDTHYQREKQGTLEAIPT
jgi:hypothetical protein